MYYVVWKLALDFSIIREQNIGSFSTYLVLKDSNLPILLYLYETVTKLLIYFQINMYITVLNSQNFSYVSPIDVSTVPIRTEYIAKSEICEYKISEIASWIGYLVLDSDSKFLESCA